MYNRTFLKKKRPMNSSKDICVFWGGGGHQMIQPSCPLSINLTNEAEAAQAQVKDKQRVNGQSDPVLDHTTAPENANASCE